MNPTFPKEQRPPSEDAVKLYEALLSHYEHPERLKDMWPFKLIRQVIAKAKE